MSAENLLGDRVLDENNQLFYAPSSDIRDDKSQDFLIFMITGNPGLIKYYEPFLSTLHNLLSSSSTAPSARFSIYGHSLAGFDLSKGEMREPDSLVGLLDQIIKTESLLFKQVDRLQKAAVAAAVEEKPLKVLLIGHSVGAYILLELIQRHRKSVERFGLDFDLIGGILLFPTITHLAQSPQGMIYSVSPCWPPVLWKLSTSDLVQRKRACLTGLREYFNYQIFLISLVLSSIFC